MKLAKGTHNKTRDPKLRGHMTISFEIDASTHGSMLIQILT